MPYMHTAYAWVVGVYEAADERAGPSSTAASNGENHMQMLGF